MATPSATQLHTEQHVHAHCGNLRQSAPLFDTPAKLDLLRDATLELVENYSLSLRAWAFFNELALRLNQVDRTPSRKVMYQFWHTELTFEKSYLARLNYVHQIQCITGL